jgi:predicted RNA binding protein with dsRBD fold (UPF0201 family)
MDEVTVHVEADVNPTESEAKVKQAIENVFGNIPTQTKPLHKTNLMVAEAEGQGALEKFHNLLRRERIRSAARPVLFEGIDKKTISFCLNKQVAYAGHISFSKEVNESPLGPIKVKITCENPRELVEWLVPRNL